MDVAQITKLVIKTVGGKTLFDFPCEKKKNERQQEIYFANFHETPPSLTAGRFVFSVIDHDGEPLFTTKSTVKTLLASQQLKSHPNGKWKSLELLEADNELYETYYDSEADLEDADDEEEEEEEVEQDEDEDEDEEKEKTKKTPFNRRLRQLRGIARRRRKRLLGGRLKNKILKKGKIPLLSSLPPPSFQSSFFHPMETGSFSTQDFFESLNANAARAKKKII
eukprot:TRINITY_DN1404_c0_g1_i3.p1 TRINITY_DN1404_c0_g1~~TRINITY_DN1404_c0_g1_i3.p1  ORF type:complete len:237 (-),score=64.69 TRINITY_DN1404_c0_g1_i3:235-903(-)